MSPKLIDKTEKKTQIIEAAMMVFAKNGFHNTKMIDIADYAGIGKGTIYEYFRSKEEIFHESYLYSMKKMKAQAEIKLHHLTDPTEKLIGIIESFFDSFEAFHDSIYIMFDFWAEGIRKRDQQMENYLREIYYEYRQFIAGILDEGKAQGVFRDIDSNFIASSILGALDGLVLQWIVFSHDYNVHIAIDEFKKMVLTGIRK